MMPKGYSAKIGCKEPKDTYSKYWKISHSLKSWERTNIFVHSTQIINMVTERHIEDAALIITADS